MNKENNTLKGGMVSIHTHNALASRSQVWLYMDQGRALR